MTARHRPVGEVAGEVIADVAERGLVEGDVDEAARAGRSRARAARRGSRGPPRCPSPDRSGRSRRAHPGVRARPSSRSGRPPPASARRSRARAAAGQHGRRRRSSSRRDAGSALELVGPESESRRARAEALQEDVCAVHQPQQRFASARVAERARQRTLRRVRREEHRSLAVPERRSPGAASSPVSGRSTLITSAPSAPRISAQYGPAIDVVTSSTRIPSSGEKTSTHHRHSTLCEDAAVFQSIVDAVSGSNWSYLIVFAIAMIDAFFPLVPSEATAIAAGVVAGAGGLRVEFVILAAALGAIAGDNICFLRRALSRRTADQRFFQARRTKKTSSGQGRRSTNEAVTSSSSRASSRAAGPWSPSRPASSTGCRGGGSSATTSSPA